MKLGEWLQMIGLVAFCALMGTLSIVLVSLVLMALLIVGAVAAAIVLLAMAPSLAIETVAAGFNCVVDRSTRRQPQLQIAQLANAINAGRIRVPVTARREEANPNDETTSKSPCAPARSGAGRRGGRGAASPPVADAGG